MEEYFKNFKNYAFRLELLQKYDVEEEKELLEHFQKTGKVKEEGIKDWLEIIKNAKKRGVVIKRVHVVALPLTDYLKYELATYKHTENAGEVIFIMLCDKFHKISSKINFDCWLFDDKTVLKINYDQNGKYLGFEEIKENLGSFIELKNRLLASQDLMKPKDFAFSHLK